MAVTGMVTLGAPPTLPGADTVFTRAATCEPLVAEL